MPINWVESSEDDDSAQEAEKSWGRLFMDWARMMTRFVKIVFLGVFLLSFLNVANADEAFSAKYSSPCVPVDELGQLRAEVEELKRCLSQPADREFPLHECADASLSDWQLSAGYEMVFAKPHIKESFQSSTLDVVTGTQSLHPYEFQFDPSSRVWIGAQSEAGLGLRARYWDFNSSADTVRLTATPTLLPGASAATVIYPANILAVIPGDTLIASDRLAMQTFDLEGTRSMTLLNTKLTGAAGLRYAQIDQENSAQVVSALAPGSLNWSRRFHGLGPSLAAEGRHPIGTFGLSLIGTARGALLFGQKTLQRSVTGDVTPNPGAPNVELRGADEVSGVFEASFGAEYQLYDGPVGAITVRGMYEGQLWTDAGAPTLTFLGFEGLVAGLVWRR